MRVQPDLLLSTGADKPLFVVTAAEYEKNSSNKFIGGLGTTSLLLALSSSSVLDMLPLVWESFVVPFGETSSSACCDSVGFLAGDLEVDFERRFEAFLLREDDDGERLRREAGDTELRFFFNSAFLLVEVLVSFAR